MPPESARFTETFGGWLRGRARTPPRPESVTRTAYVVCCNQAAAEGAPSLRKDPHVNGERHLMVSQSCRRAQKNPLAVAELC